MTTEEEAVAPLAGAWLGGSRAVLGNDADRQDKELSKILRE